MSDEAAVVVGILGLIAAMIVVLLRQQRRREARLAALPEIEIPIQSVGERRSSSPRCRRLARCWWAWSLGATDQARQHAAAAVLLGMGIGMVGMFAGCGSHAASRASVGFVAHRLASSCSWARSDGTSISTSPASSPRRSRSARRHPAPGARGQAGRPRRGVLLRAADRAQGRRRPRRRSPHRAAGRRRGVRHSRPASAALPG